MGEGKDGVQPSTRDALIYLRPTEYAEVILTEHGISIASHLVLPRPFRIRLPQRTLLDLLPLVIEGRYVEPTLDEEALVCSRGEWERTSISESGTILIMACRQAIPMCVRGHSQGILCGHEEAD